MVLMIIFRQEIKDAYCRKDLYTTNLRRQREREKQKSRIRMEGESIKVGSSDY